MKIAFDIDGVLADNTHWAPTVASWDDFIEAISTSKPIPEPITIAEALFADNALIVNPHHILFLTARPERCRKSTLEWLSNNIAIDLPINLDMRPNEIDRPNAEYKLERCLELKPDLIFEDDEEAAKLLRDNGFKVMLFLRRIE
ncbi:hypothetical protein LCGC14_2196680 [marine sediment metagenome]|uniref:Nucleotidase n=1 Tax=marine sediment metagenome TaxID=412755 RepID=A0A0F9FVD8_9ZZZZ